MQESDAKLSNLQSKKPKLSRSIIINMLLVIILSVGIMGGLQVHYEYSKLQIELNTMRNKFLYSYSELLKTEVDKVISYIEYQQSLITPRLNQSIKDRVNEACAVAGNIFNQYKDTKNLDEIKKLIKDALRPIRFNQGRGYYFAFNLDGVEELFADKPQMEGQNMLNIQGAKGEYVVKDMLDIVNKDKEGFYQYTWTKPNRDGHFTKRAYVKLFEPLGWVFGTGDYIDDITKDVQNEVILFIEQIRFRKDGYIFAGEWDGTSLNGPAKGKNMWDITDSKGKKIVQEMIQIAKKEGNGYLEYVMPNLEDKKTAPKLSYVVGVAEWGWYIGSGIYIDEIEASVEKRKKEVEDKIISQLIRIFMVLALLVFFIYLVAFYISRKARQNIDTFTGFFERADVELVEIDADQMDFYELERLAHSVNKMLKARKIAEEEREKLQGQLIQAQKMDSIGRLAGGVAHDFNNMLSVIIGYSEIATLQIDADHPLYKPLTQIHNAAERSANLTRQLLAFARKQNITPKILDLNRTVEGMLKMLRRIIGEDIELIWLPDDNLWQVKIDPSQIDQIMANLCVNARDAISSGGGKIIIETRNTLFDEKYCSLHPYFVEGEYASIVVSDDGCGMDKETILNIFEPFFTTKEFGEGTGLGLATVYGIVKQNSGFINVYSEQNRGSSFTIYLPRHATQSDEIAKSEAIQINSSSKGETILVVDDESTILDIAKEILESYGYKVLTAVAPMEAIQISKEYDGEIHLLISDVIMPQMNGRELADRVIVSRPSIKLLFMSGYTASVIAHRGVLDDGVQFIQKPFSMNALTIKVREILDQGLSKDNQGSFVDIYRVKSTIRSIGNPIFIGLTGSIATGKSTVADMLKYYANYKDIDRKEPIKQRFVKIIDFDILAREVVEPKTKALGDIVTLFGSNIVDTNGYLDRKALSKIIFEDVKKRQELEKITHPAIFDLFCQKVQRVVSENLNPIIVAVIPLLIELNLQSLFDKIIVVYTSSEVQLQRLMKREDIDQKRATAMLKSQMDIESKKVYADFLIDNSGDSQNTQKQVHDIWRKITI
ncbi:MAG: dephospho-CoA kinase [Desulfamplus sp.]|nr:dephospho-CoA kinase [Desulfamplus sp.]